MRIKTSELNQPIYADPMACPFCTSEDIRFANTLQAREVDDASEEIHLDEHQCMSCGRSFWV